VRVPRLEDDGVTAGQGAGGEASGDVEEVAGMRERPVTGGGVPESPSHVDEVLGAAVAVGVVEVAAAAEVLACEGVGGRDDVPGGATVREVVDRREPAGDVEGFVERRAQGSGQPDALGDGGERGEHSRGVRTTDDVEVEDLSLVFAQAQAFGEEEEVEESGLGGLCEVSEGVEFDVAARGRIGPYGRVVHAREVRGEVDL